jgi:hypothetical protein
VSTLEALKSPRVGDSWVTTHPAPSVSAASRHQQTPPLWDRWQPASEPHNSLRTWPSPFVCSYLSLASPPSLLCSSSSSNLATVLGSMPPKAKFENVSPRVAAPLPLWWRCVLTISIRMIPLVLYYRFLGCRTTSCVRLGLDH